MTLHTETYRALALASLVVAASGRHVGAGMPIVPKSGAAMCALTPADFQNAGISNASKPTANVQDAGASVYCVYAGKSAATGGIELDVFFPAGSNTTESRATYKTAIDEAQTLTPIRIAGADEAHWSANAVSGGPPVATITVRRANLVFTLGIPASKNAQAQIAKLVELVLQRF